MLANPRRRRQLAVWWHVITSVGWLSMTTVLVTLLALALTSPDQAAAATSMAEHVDGILLAPLANASAATGIVLGLGTPWGVALHRWVLAKLSVTLVQLQLGIFVLSGALRDATATAQAGQGAGASWPLVAGASLMAGAIAAQAWLSVAKPGGPVRRSRRPGKPVTAPSWVLVAVVVGPMADIPLGVVLGHPTPVFSLLVVVVTVVARQRAGAARGAVPTPA